MATKKVTTKTVAAEQLDTPIKATKQAKTQTIATVEKAITPASGKKAAAAPKSVPTSKVTFTLPKEAVEEAETVAVLGDFNNWQNGVTLKKQKDGSYAASIELEKGRTYEYRFLINGEKWENAWNAEAYKPTPFGAFNSVVTA